MIGRKSPLAISYVGRIAPWLQLADAPPAPSTTDDDASRLTDVLRCRLGCLAALGLLSFKTGCQTEPKS